jgi:hypothetical protein
LVYFKAQEKYLSQRTKKIVKAVGPTRTVSGID